MDTAVLQISPVSCTQCSAQSLLIAAMAFLPWHVLFSGFCSGFCFRVNSQWTQSNTLGRRVVEKRDDDRSNAVPIQHQDTGSSKTWVAQLTEGSRHSFAQSGKENKLP